MDASSARASSSADEAILLPLSFSSLPPSHYLQTSPHLLTTQNSDTSQPSSDSRLFNGSPTPIAAVTATSTVVPVTTTTTIAAASTTICNSSNSSNNNNNAGYLNSFNSSIAAASERDELTSCNSLNLTGNCHRRQSLKSETRIPENETSGSSRSTSSPQLMSIKSRSKVYRRASLKSLVSLNIAPPAPTQAKIMRLTNRGKVADRRAISLESRPKILGHQEDKENVTCNPLSSSHSYSGAARSKSIVETIVGANEKPSDLQQPHQDDKQQQQQQTKGKSSCSSFLPILSLIPNTAISFQYPSPKMKFSWWRNKIS